MNTDTLWRRAPAARCWRRPLRRSLVGVLLAGCFSVPDAATTLPQVVSGQAAFVQQGNVFSITSTPNAILNWQSFSVLPGQVTRFIQQSASSSVLNRIVGQDPSQILGALQSNGRVFLINPNGIVFGRDARIDVGALVAATLNVSDGDFLAGRRHFVGSPTAGAISNAGQITTGAGGQVFLLAPSITNSGIISAPNGDVLLAAGHSVQLVDSADPGVQVVVSAPDSSAVNLGQIVANGGRIGIYGALIRQRGVVSADSAQVGVNGKIVFTARGDTLLEAGSRTSATGAGVGGSVAVLGQRVAVYGSVDASGELGGGTVLVGGDVHGANALIQNAQQAILGQGAVLRADARHSGAGGKIVLWSDQLTKAYGTISARGGAQGGDGGFVETSGKRQLNFHVHVDVGAAKGKGGTLLLDPVAITIEGGTGDGADTPDGTGTFQGNTNGIGQVVFGDADISAGSTSTIYQSELQGLGAGTNIVLEASKSISASGTFTASEIALPLNSSLTLRTRNASVDTGGTQGIDLVTGVTGGLLTVRASGTGAIHVSTGTGSSPQAANMLLPNLSSAGGAVTLSGSGNIGVGAIAALPPGAPGGNVAISAAGHVYASGAIDTRPGTVGASGNVSISAGTYLSVAASSTIYANTLTLLAGTGIYGSNSADGSVVSAPLHTSVSALNAGNLISGDISLANAGTDLTILDPSTLGYGIAQTGGGAFLTNDAGHSITVSAPVSAAGTIGFKADKMLIGASMTAPVVTLGPLAGTAIDLGSTGKAASALELSNGELNFIAADTLAVGGPTSGNLNVSAPIAPVHVTNLSLSSLGSVTQSAAAVIGGAQSVQVQGSSVTLLEANNTGVISGAASSGDFQFRSANQISVTLPGTSNALTDVGLSVTGGANLLLWSDGTGISQYNPIQGGALALKASGAINLSNTANSIAAIAIDHATASSDVTVHSASNLVVRGVLDVSGVSAPNARLHLETGTGQTLTVSSPIAAAHSEIVADNLSLGSTITGAETEFSPATSGRAVTVGATACQVGPCLLVRDLYRVNSATVAIGSTDSAIVTGDIYVAGISVDGAAASNRHANTTRIGLLSNVAGTATVTQGGVINVQDLGVEAGGAINLPLSNAVSNLAGSGGTSFTFSSGADLTVATLSGNNSNGHGYNVVGVNAAVGDLAITSSAGNLHMDAAVSAPGHAVSLSAANAISGAGVVSATSVHATAGSGIALTTAVHTLFANNTGANSDITIDNTGALTLATVSQPGTSTGNISIHNVGAVNVEGPISTDAGAISIDAHSPLTVNGSITSTAGNIHLTAGTNGSVNDQLTVQSGAVVTTGGTITFDAGDAINISGSSTVSPSPILHPNLNVPPLPLMSTCLANPQVAGCDSVLPSLSSCIAETELIGCSVVLPSLASCIVTPSARGCSVVLPTIGACTQTPSLAGCSVILPTLAACVSLPSTAGCSAVLPTLAACVSVPSTAGCSAVLPTVAVCTLTPELPACSVVLPSLAACVAAPATPGCSVVLPTIAICTATPVTPGCSAVLPTLVQCTSAPSTSGCSAVLPSIGQCTSAPSKPGCSAVLPTMSQCLLTPTAAGCTVVLPSIASCIATPSAAGCSVVLPTLATCTVTPSEPGCSVVLPTLVACTVSPTLPGCAVVLPTLTACLASPSTPGCAVVLPTLTACLASPNTPGCAVVLPTLTACIASPNTPGCSIVLPTLAACTVAPTVPGCAVVLPTLTACLVSPSTPGCSVVLPTLAACIASASTPGCAVVLPTLAACAAAPSTPGCMVVLPTLAACIASPSTPGCAVVLPTLAACAAAPSTPGCTAQLPTLAVCIAAPTLPGCATVLPQLSTCVRVPSTPGCAAVLPSIAMCSATPKLAGCSAVLPDLDTCTTAPTAPGCAVVLPTLASCIADPSLSGCGVVLPGVAACAASPGLPGCASVPPTLAACSANPMLAGCTHILPPLASCILTPGLAGCSAVLPALGACTATPGLPGCSVVLPSLATCSVTPSTAGCAVVLPSLSACVAVPATTGCAAVLPKLSACIAAPSSIGCVVVLPSLSACIAAPSSTGCVVVLPTLSACVLAPSGVGCSVVLPSLTACSAAPTLAGCTAVLPSLASCVATPSAAGCAVVLPPVDRCVADPSLAICVIVSPTQNNQPVAQALNLAVNFGLALTPDSHGVAPIIGVPDKASAPGGPMSGAQPGTTAPPPPDDSKVVDSKKDDKKDDKKDTVVAKDTGAKKDEPVKKLYCN